MQRFGDLRQSDPDWFEFRWRDRLVGLRAGARHYEVDDVVRPVRSGGFYLVCTAAGETHRVEPLIPSLAGQTLVDGSVTWVVTAPGDASVPTVASCVYTVTPAGIVQDSTAVDAARATSRVRLDAAAAALGLYEILAVMTDSSSEEHSERVQLRVVE